MTKQPTDKRKQAQARQAQGKRDSKKQAANRLEGLAATYTGLAERLEAVVLRLRPKALRAHIRTIKHKRRASDE